MQQIFIDRLLSHFEMKRKERKWVASLIFVCRKSAMVKVSVGQSVFFCLRKSSDWILLLISPTTRNSVSRFLRCSCSSVDAPPWLLLCGCLCSVALFLLVLPGCSSLVAPPRLPLSGFLQLKSILISLISEGNLCRVFMGDLLLPFCPSSCLGSGGP